RLYVPYGAASVPPAPPYLAQTPLATTNAPYRWPPFVGVPQIGQALVTGDYLIQQTFAHEGRIPPRVLDNRVNPNLVAQNIGDDSPGVIRLRRVWDSWSTAYSNAPTSGYDPVVNFPTGPPFTNPVYPSYPPPYPAPLRGIQIQVRVV